VCLFVAHALKNRNKVTEVLPALRELIIREQDVPEPVRAALNPFLTARQLSGHPVDVRCETESVAEGWPWIPVIYTDPLIR
jgi:hypothetical protein